MSSILKALKKLEDERAIHRPDSLKIGSEILRGEKQQRHSATGLVLAALLLFAGGSIATYLYMKPNSSPVVDVAKKPVTVSGSTQPMSKSKPPLQTLSRAMTDIKTEELPKAIEIVPAKNYKIVRTIPPPKPQKHVVATKSAPSISPKPQGQPKLDQQKKLPTVTTTVQPPAVAGTVPALRVNGIAYQGAADSVAVINGVPVSVGGMIEGAQIEAIQKDRVRFSYNGDNFEIPLGKSNR